MSESMASPSPRCVIYLRVSTEEQAQRDFTEEGFSLPAQREACLQHIRDQGWTLVDEYVDRDSASKRSGERPQFKAMLARIFEQGDVNVVVVHKLDRFSRDAAHHLAVRAALRQRGVRLVSVQEQLEETASGRLVEGIHALMAEFYSANLSAEVKKGMKQKVEMGGWTHRAPLGYINVREWAGGRRVSYVSPDPERADLVQLAFNLYATGDYTLEALLEELRARGLTNRGRKDYPAMPMTMHGLTWLLTNKFYAGLVEWQGVEHKGLHEPLVDSRTFLKVQDLFASRSGRWTREIRHAHYLKGFLYCAVCGRGLSLQRSKGRYLYFFCLGQKDRRRPTGCKEAYVAAEKLERQVEELYTRVQLPPEWARRLRSSMEVEIIARQDRNAAEREFLTRKLAKVETERRKLLEAYYAGAIDVALLRSEQRRIASDIREVEERLKNVEATLAEWQDVLAIAFKFATNCGQAYRSANGRTRKLYNSAVFERLVVRNGEITEIAYREPFGALFVLPEFEQGRLERETGDEAPSTKQPVTVEYRLASMGGV